MVRRVGAKRTLGRYSGMSSISLTDEFRLRQIQEKIDQGQDVTPEEIEFIGRWLDRVEDDLNKALRPSRRLA
jgi:hypothetical protein